MNQIRHNFLFLHRIKLDVHRKNLFRVQLLNDLMALIDVRTYENVFFLKS